MLVGCREHKEVLERLDLREHRDSVEQQVELARRVAQVPQVHQVSRDNRAWLERRV